MRVLIAADKFKGSLSARQVADALSDGLRAAEPSVEVERVAIADGGDGTVDAALSAGFDAIEVGVLDPVGKAPIRARYAVRGRIAVVELAEASGLGRLPDGPDPWRASTLGTGEVIAGAIRAGCRDVVVGLGGSCSTDGGAGILVGLGARLLDGRGDPLPPSPEGLLSVEELDLSALDDRVAGTSVTVASDVDNPLTGPACAAAVFGPQKGATKADVHRLDAALSRWAELVDDATGTDCRGAPGAGAAGGAGFALLSTLGATMRPGVELVMELVGFVDLLGRADVVVTGEGALDAQTLGGKAPYGVARAAAAAGVPVVAVCGRNELDAADLGAAAIERVWSLAEIEPDPRRCLTHAAELLRRLGSTMAPELGRLRRR